MIEIRRYEISNKNAWDDFVTNSRVDTLLFKRDYMDYHSDRFHGLSFMIYRKGKLQAVIPGNVDGSVFYSHQGLTYGGFVLSRKITTNDVLQAFSILNDELKKNGVEEVVYKPVPLIYHTYPAQEDIYSLYRLGAKKIACNISSTIWQKGKIPFLESRKSGIRKAKKENILIFESQDYDIFWELLKRNLMKVHGMKPVHSLDEIKYLKSKFPEQIKLFSAKIDNEIIGGCVLFLMKQIVHVQYIAANEKGKLLGAIDLLFDELINSLYKHIPIFDFGHSNEQFGKYLNENLIFQKEGFGGRGIVYDIYKYKIQ